MLTRSLRRRRARGRRPRAASRCTGSSRALYPRQAAHIYSRLRCLLTRLTRAQSSLQGRWRSCRTTSSVGIFCSRASDTSRWRSPPMRIAAWCCRQLHSCGPACYRGRGPPRASDARCDARGPRQGRRSRLRVYEAARDGQESMARGLARRAAERRARVISTSRFAAGRSQGRGLCGTRCCHLREPTSV